MYSIASDRNRTKLGNPQLLFVIFYLTFIQTNLLLSCSQSFAQRAESPTQTPTKKTEVETQTPHFQRHIIPLLSRLGCNGRSCHGSFQGQGGFQLSLFGYDFDADHRALTSRSARYDSPRVDPRTPPLSLLIQKALAEIEHEGGQRFEEDGWQHRLMTRWIEQGAVKHASIELTSLKVQPEEIVFSDDLSSTELTVEAFWADGTREVVTSLCRFRTNDDSIAKVSDDGIVSSIGSGDTHIVAFYDNGIVAVPVLRPHPRIPNADTDEHKGLAVKKNASDGITTNQHRQPLQHSTHPIDRLVVAKLDKLGIIASERCDDSEFLRRLSIDLTGTLPTPTEVIEFLADNRPDKRDRKITDLLDRPAYAAWWANRLCDFTGCNPSQQAELGQETAVQWYRWIYQRLLENTPYDELTRRIVLSVGRESGQSYRDYAEQTSSYYREVDANDFSDRQTLPHYWSRRSMKEPQEAAQAFAQNFLGVRLQCAQCHKHPFAPWTQQDYNEFAKFFKRIEFGISPTSVDEYKKLAQSVGINVRSNQGEPIRSDMLRMAKNGRTIPWRELYVRTADGTEQLSLLRSGVVEIQGEQDPRVPIIEWMTQENNPYFANAIVNRIWSGYFGVGIVDPTDDLTPANPPSNPELYNWLAQEFVKQKYDLKWLHRTIVSSETYQRSWRPNETNQSDRRNFSRAVPRRIPAEIVYDMLKQTLAGSDQLTEVRSDLTRRAIGDLSMMLAGTYAMQVFGKPDRMINCDCERVNEPTLLQAVYLQNDPLVEQFLDSSKWLGEIKESEESATEKQIDDWIHSAWLRSLSRPPNEPEIVRAKEHLRGETSLSAGMRDLMWALINTKEYILLK